MLGCIFPAGLTRLLITYTFSVVITNSLFLLYIYIIYKKGGFRTKGELNRQKGAQLLHLMQTLESVRLYIVRVSKELIGQRVQANMPKQETMPRKRHTLQ